MVRPSILEVLLAFFCWKSSVCYFSVFPISSGFLDFPCFFPRFEISGNFTSLTQITNKMPQSVVSIGCLVSFYSDLLWSRPVIKLERNDNSENVVNNLTRAMLWNHHFKITSFSAQMCKYFSVTRRGVLPCVFVPVSLKWHLNQYVTLGDGTVSCAVTWRKATPFLVWD